MTYEQEINNVLLKLGLLKNKYYQEVQEKKIFKKAGSFVVSILKSNAPVYEGNLRNSIEVLPFRRSKNAIHIGPNYRKGGSHAHLVEYGHLTKNGKRVEGNPFTKKTYEDTKFQVLANVIKEIESLQKKIEKQL